MTPPVDHPIAAAVAGGRHYAVVTAIVTAFIAPVVIVAGLSPVAGAGLMALMCITVGRLSRLGLHKSALLVPVMLSWALIDRRPPTHQPEPNISLVAL